MSKSKKLSAEELERLLRGVTFTEEERDRMIRGDWPTEDSVSNSKISRNQIAAKPAVQAQIMSASAFHHPGSEKAQCPHCYSPHNVRPYGELVIDGSPRPQYHCTSCNRLFSDIPAGVKVLMDEAKNLGAESVGFIAPSDLVNTVHTVDDSQSNYQMQQQNHKLDQVNSNLSMMSGNISQLNYTIEDLMRKVVALAQQNQALVEKMSCDPIVHIRKAVSEFDLK